MAQLFSDPSPARVHRQPEDFLLSPNALPVSQDFLSDFGFDYSVIPPQIKEEIIAGVAKDEEKLLLPSPKFAENDANVPILPDFAPVKPKTPRTNGKQMIKMNGPKRVRKPTKLKDEEVSALNKMERFLCVMFCQKCQANTNYDGVQLVILLCERCCERINKFQI